MSITISLNSNRMELEEALSVSEALVIWGYKSQDIAVAINQEFVPGSEYQQRIVQSQDEIDVIAPVQGG